MRSTSLVRAVTMMIGRWRVAGRAAQDAAHLEAGEHRQVQVEHHDVGRTLGDRRERGVAGADQLDRRLAIALERVGDQPADVGLVLDDEDACRARQSGGGDGGGWTWSALAETGFGHAGLTFPAGERTRRARVTGMADGIGRAFPSGDGQVKCGLRARFSRRRR